MARFLTAQEIAEAAAAHGVAGVPRTKRNVNAMAKRLGWANLPATHCRRREGRTGGGGLEYHVSLLPEALRAALGHRAAAEAATRAVAVRTEAQGREVARLAPVSLGARQRQVMEARGQVLTAVLGEEARRGLSRAQAIAALVAAARAGGALLKGFGLAPETLALANDRAGGSGAVGRSTLYGWFKAWSEGGVAALAPLPPKVADPLPPGWDGFLRFYARPSKPEATAALRDYLAEVTDPRLALTIDQVRHVLRHKLNDIERHVGREGLLTLRSRMAYVARGTENLWPTTIYTADGHTFDAEVMDAATRRAIRPEITSVVDVATRRCVGIAISRKENVVAVTEALRVACVDHGIPALFYVDNGAGYRNKALDADVGGLMGRLWITKMHALPYGSQAKGLVERFQKTVWVTLARKLPSFIGADMDKEAKGRQHKASRADLEALGTSRRLPSWEEFRAMCEAAVAVYNRTPHSALPKIEDPATGRRRHMSPDEAWAAHVAQGWEPVPVEEDLKDDLFRPYVERVARRGLVELNTNSYFHRALESFHGERVLVGYDDADASRVWVRELDRALGQPGRLICVAAFEGNKVDYVPVSAQRKAEERRAKGRLARLEDKVRAVREELDPVALLEARAEMPLVARPEPVLEVVHPPQPAAAPSAPSAAPSGPPRFDRVADLAAWVLAHPQDLTERRAGALRKALLSETELELLRVRGVDPEALRALLRATRIPPSDPAQERRSA